MGCFHGTCGISQLPILDENPVKFFLIRKNSNPTDMTGFCNPDELYYPITIPLYGKYNDYGGVTPNTFTNIQKNTILKLLPGFDFSEDFSEEIRKHNIGFFLVHSEIYHALITTKPEFGVLFDVLYRDLYHMLEKELNSGLYFDFYHMCQKHDNTLSRKIEFSELTFRRAIRSYVECVQDYYGSRPVDITNAIMDLSPIIELMVFYQNMNAIRKIFTPQTGAGSQSLDLDIYHSLCNAMDRQILDISKAYEEDD